MLSHGQNDLTEHLACSRVGWVGVEHEKKETDLMQLHRKPIRKTTLDVRCFRLIYGPLSSVHQQFARFADRLLL